MTFDYVCIQLQVSNQGITEVDLNKYNSYFRDTPKPDPWRGLKSQGVDNHPELSP